MSQAIMTCRVCGKQYKGCRTPNPEGVFRYKEVACSPECGQEYLRRILESRGIKSEIETVENTQQSVVVADEISTENESDIMENTCEAEDSMEDIEDFDESECDEPEETDEG